MKTSPPEVSRPAGAEHKKSPDQPPASSLEDRKRRGPIGHGRQQGQLVQYKHPAAGWVWDLASYIRGTNRRHVHPLAENASLTLLQIIYPLVGLPVTKRQGSLTTSSNVYLGLARDKTPGSNPDRFPGKEMSCLFVEADDGPPRSCAKHKTYEQQNSSGMIV